MPLIERVTGGLEMQKGAIQPRRIWPPIPEQASARKGIASKQIVTKRPSAPKKHDAQGLIPKITKSTLRWNSINGSGAPSVRGFVQYQAIRGHDWVFARFPQNAK